MGKACESGEEWKEAGSESRGGADKGALVVRAGERLWRLGGGGGYKGGGQTGPEDSWGRLGSAQTASNVPTCLLTWKENDKFSGRTCSDAIKTHLNEPSGAKN